MSYQYYESKNVKIFPCSSRGVYDVEISSNQQNLVETISKVFDPEARMATEANFTVPTSYAFGKSSFVISYENQLLKAVIGGYYFEISNLEDLPNFLSIRLAKHVLIESEMDTRSTLCLVPFVSQSSGVLGLDFKDTDGNYKCCAIAGHSEAINAENNQEDSNSIYCTLDLLAVDNYIEPLRNALLIHTHLEDGSECNESPYDIVYTDTSENTTHKLSEKANQSAVNLKATLGEPSKEEPDYYPTNFNLYTVYEDLSTKISEIFGTESGGEPELSSLGGLSAAITKEIQDREAAIGKATEGDVAATGVYAAIEAALAEAKQYADNGDDDTLYDDAEVVEAIEDHESRIGAIESAIGTEAEGIIKDIADNAKAIEDEAKARAQADADTLNSAKAYTDEEIVGLEITIEKKTVGEVESDYIVIKNKAGTEVASVNAAKFVKDGMLDSADYSTDTKKLTLTWNTDAGKAATEIDLNDLVNTYTGSEHIVVGLNGSISIADDVALDSEVAALKTELEGKIDTKRTEAEVDAQIDAKLSTVNATIDTKADAEKTTAALALKANVADVVANTTFAQFQTNNADAIAAACSSAVAEVAEVGYALATEVANTYATKDELGNAVSGINTTLADYTKKTEVYTTTEIDNLITNINQGNQATAGEVSAALGSYKTSNDKEIANLKEKDTALTTAVEAAQAQADEGVADAKIANDAIAALTTGAVATNTSDITVIKGRLETLESAKSNHEQSITAATDKITVLEAADAAINETLSAVTDDIAELENEATELAGSIREITEKFKDYYTAEQVDAKIGNIDYTNFVTDSEFEIIAKAVKTIYEKGTEDGEESGLLITKTNVDDYTITRTDDKLSLAGFADANAGTLLPKKVPIYETDGEGNDTNEVDHYELGWFSFTPIDTVITAAEGETNIAIECETTDDTKTYALSLDLSNYAEKSTVDNIFNLLGDKKFITEQGEQDSNSVLDSTIVLDLSEQVYSGDLIQIDYQVYTGDISVSYTDLYYYKDGGLKKLVHNSACTEQSLTTDDTSSCLSLRFDASITYLKVSLCRDSIKQAMIENIEELQDNLSDLQTRIQALEEIIAVLTAPDYTALNAALAKEIASTEENNYSEADWTAYAEALADAKAAQSSRVQADIDAAAEALESAIADMVKLNRADLQNAINAAEQKTNNNKEFEDALWIAFQDALTAANTTLSSRDQAAIDAAAKVLADAQAALKAADKSKLSATINGAPAPTTELDYPVEAWATYKAVYDNAVSVNENSNSQAEIDEVNTVLEEAIAVLNDTKLDYTALDAAIGKAPTVETDYTVDDWTTLQTALTAATVAKNVRVQSEIDDAAQTLNSVIANLVALNRSTLSQAIISAENVTNTGYEQEKWDTFIEALSNARNVLTSSRVQSEIDDAAQTLNDAIDGLKAPSTTDI